MEDCFVESHEAHVAPSARVLTTSIASVDIILIRVTHFLSLDLEYDVDFTFETAHESVHGEEQHLSFVEVSDQQVHTVDHNKRNLQNHANRDLSVHEGDYLVLKAHVEGDYGVRALSTSMSPDDELLLQRWFEIYFCQLMRMYMTSTNLIDCLVAAPR